MFCVILFLYFGFPFRIEGGIPPLVELLEFTDAKVQRAAAGSLRTLAFKNDENKNQVDDFNFLLLQLIRLGISVLFSNFDTNNALNLKILDC